MVRKAKEKGSVYERLFVNAYVQEQKEQKKREEQVIQVAESLTPTRQANSSVTSRIGEKLYQKA